MHKVVSQGYAILDFTEAEMLVWQWHQLDHMQVICTTLQMDMSHHITSSFQYIVHYNPLQPTTSTTQPRAVNPLTDMGHICPILKKALRIDYNDQFSICLHFEY